MPNTQGELLPGVGSQPEVGSFTASLVIQGRHRFYTLSLHSDLLAETCVVETREENPIDGFQRLLDKKRAKEIADYIDSGLGTIPTSIVLSAQADAELEYVRKTRTLKFKKTKRSFLILDGQHRIYGFSLAKTRVRVPVVIYNRLSRAQECNLFMDINTKQRPVPTELLLDIKRLADSETDTEALLRDVFDLFSQEPSSPLLGRLSPAKKSAGKISRVTFNAALKGILGTFPGGQAVDIYSALAAYVQACLHGLRVRNADDGIVNPTLFRALILLFPTFAERVADRHGHDYSVVNFDEIVGPFFSRLKKSYIQQPGTSHITLVDNLKKALQTGFAIPAGR